MRPGRTLIDHAVSHLHAIVVWLTYPLALSVCLLLAGLAAALFGRFRFGVGLVVAGLGWSLLWSVPAMSDGLRDSLERTHADVDVARLPHTDAIVVLGGGGGYSRLDRPGVQIAALRSSRIAAGARAWLAQRAPVVILSGGAGRPGHTEAHNMSRVISRLGVPRSAQLLEDRSKSTQENAIFTAQLARAHRIRRVVLVTSAIHMPRASLLFRQAGLEVVPLAVPEHFQRGDDWEQRWLPSRGALWRSGRAFKEYAGLIGARVVAPLGGAEREADPSCTREAGAKKKT